LRVLVILLFESCRFKNISIDIKLFETAKGYVIARLAHIFVLSWGTWET